MAYEEIETILARQLASYLAMPIFLVDPEGQLVFFNEPAELILGVSFDETGAMPAEEWGSSFRPEDSAGNPLPLAELPLVKALTLRQPAQRSFWITAMTGTRRHLSVTAIPLIGQAGRFLGALALFWEADE